MPKRSSGGAASKDSKSQSLKKKATKKKTEESDEKKTAAKKEAIKKKSTTVKKAPAAPKTAAKKAAAPAAKKTAAPKKKASTKKASVKKTETTAKEPAAAPKPSVAAKKKIAQKTTSTTPKKTAAKKTASKKISKKTAPAKAASVTEKTSAVASEAAKVVVKTAEKAILAARETAAEAVKKAKTTAQATRAAVGPSVTKKQKKRTAQRSNRRYGGRVDEEILREMGMGTKPVQGPKYFFNTEIPENYQETYIYALARDPEWLFAYWEILPEDIETAQKTLGDEAFRESIRILRLVDLSDEEGRRYDTQINLYANNWYLKVPHAGRTYAVELGHLAPDGRYYCLASSQPVEIPRGMVSDRTDEQWQTVRTSELIKMSAGAFTGASGGMEIESQEKEFTVPGLGLSIGASENSPGHSIYLGSGTDSL